MSLETILIPVQSGFGVTVQNTLLAHASAPDKLLILLPGKGYTTDYPLLYFLRRAALGQGYDVLSVQYGFQVANVELAPDNVAFLQQDVEAAVAPARARGYRQVVIAGKSLGTTLAGELARSFSHESVALMLLTPIGGALHGLGGLPALALIGTADALYSPELVAGTQGDGVIWRVFDGLNHSLEVKGDWRASLAVLPDIIAACETFLADPA